MKTKVLFVCSRNACRSQMAEGILRALYPGHYEVFSAGERPSTMSTLAARVMAERGVDISTQYSKGFSDLPCRNFDMIVVLAPLGDRILLPTSGQVIEAVCPDPGIARGTEQEVVDGFRSIRDRLWDWIEVTFQPG